VLYLKKTRLPRKLCSSPLAKEDPVLRISGLDPHILAFSTPENAPTEIPLGFQKKFGRKKKRS
jgi:hypothetical protein